MKKIMIILAILILAFVAAGTFLRMQKTKRKHPPVVHSRNVNYNHPPRYMENEGPNEYHPQYERYRGHQRNGRGEYINDQRREHLMRTHGNRYHSRRPDSFERQQQRTN